MIMKVTFSNYSQLVNDQQSKKYLNALLHDVAEITLNGNHLEIHYQDWHDEYSPERTDPCPDYYGMYRLRWSDQNENITDPMTLIELDDHICTLYCALKQADVL